MVGLGLVGFSKQTAANEARNSDRKLQPNVSFCSKAFVFQLSLVPVAALGGHSFDARAPLRGEGDQHLKNVFFKWLGSEPIFDSDMSDLVHLFN